MLGYLWFIPLLCLAGALLNLLLGLFNTRKSLVNLVGLSASGGAMLATWVALWQFATTHSGSAPMIEPYFTWIHAGFITVNASFQLDALSAIMLAFVTFVGFLIHLYSVGYMHSESDRAYARYFGYLNLFMFSMLTLVLGSNMAVLFIGWEGVGLCSYLLIGFYFEKDWCASAGKKAFIVNRIGDFGFLLAIFVTLTHFKTLEFHSLAEILGTHGGAGAPTGTLTLIGCLLFVGAIGKSAQIPLYVWLPDAMAGPTPVSALIHAATMVTAGVYMVVRANFIYQAAPAAMLLVAVVGALTAFFAATIGLAQNDIKKVLAYSTVSQLGYMFLGAGVGGFVAAIFHVVTHAFFKACLFLGSGSVIHACGGEQDMRKMGGLKKKMPITYWTFWIATVAIAGIPPFAGFVSKDAILAKAFEAGHSNLNHFGNWYYLLWVLGLLGAGLTAFYMFRLVYMTFEGDFRGGEEAEHHLHESPWTMTLPLIILAAGSAVGGLLLGFPGQLFHLKDMSFIDAFLGPLVHHHGAEHAGHALSLGLEWGLVILSVAVAVGGILLAMRWYKKDPEFSIPKSLAERWAFSYRLILNKYWIDELYDAVVVRPIFHAATFCWKIIDVLLIDTIIVNGSAFVTELSGDILRFLQTGNVRNYALSVALGVIVLAAILW